MDASTLLAPRTPPLQHRYAFVFCESSSSRGLFFWFFGGFFKDAAADLVAYCRLLQIRSASDNLVHVKTRRIPFSNDISRRFDG